MKSDKADHIEYFLFLFLRKIFEALMQRERDMDSTKVKNVNRHFIVSQYTDQRYKGRDN